MCLPELVRSEREEPPARLGGVEPRGRRRQALAKLREFERVPGRRRRQGEPAERMVSTGTSEVRTTRSATLPNIMCDRPVRPWVPMTMRSACCCLATCTIWR